MKPSELLASLDPLQHNQHSLHAKAQDFAETNCYVDVWIEILHALGHDPTACLAFTLASDFEGDQWTFFKPPLADIDRLYGVRVEELALWRPLLRHAVTQTARGCMPLVEVDSFFLPDTSGTDYRVGHVKTTIAMTKVDESARVLHYFHNAGFHHLEGDDFDGLFRLGPRPDDELPPYSELIKLEHSTPRTKSTLRSLSLSLACHHYARAPRRNPVAAFAEQFEHDLESLLAGDLATYHAYTFATLRQLGANAELAGAYCRWMSETNAERDPWQQASAAFITVSATAKMLILKLARMINRRRAQDVSNQWTEMAQCWNRAMEALAEPLAP